MERRESARAIIFKDNKMILMYREKEGKIYYAIPGGGIDENETKEQCVIRELKEEFGIDIEVIKPIYNYEDSKNRHYYFLCKWTSGEFGTGNGEEFTDPNKKGGLYIPKMMDINLLNELPIVPKEVKKQLLRDLEEFGTNLGDEVITIHGNF